MLNNKNKNCRIGKTSLRACNLKKIKLNSISIYLGHSAFGTRSKQVRRHLATREKCS